ncbi:MAG: double-strand break repair helicase AddA [Alphaproteobacteria bacterium]|nr:double-strand break repair helicase AddA [Alphaproteobacteria bacterium]
MTSPSDYQQAQAAQAEAANPGASVFVTANAGSGKTKVLIDRIARLLLLGSPPSSFLCITYTKAAAAEMQRRLFARLGGWCVADDDALKADLRALTGQSAVDDGSVRRARALFAQALETPGGLKIQTIHAFCERLLARFPLEARAPPGFEIADEALSRDLITSAVDALAQDKRAHRALKRLSTRLDQARLETLLSRLVNQRAALKSFMQDPEDPEGPARVVRAAFGVFEEPQSILARLMQNAPWDLLSQARAFLASGAKTDQETAALIGTALQTRQPEDYLGIFLTQKREMRRKPVTKAMLEANAAVRAVFSAEGAQGAVEMALGQIRRAERALDTEAALTVSLVLNQAYRGRKALRGALDFDDLIEIATALLADPAAGSWVLYKLDGGVDHILIDEGQDTSPAQWALLEPLREEFFSGEGARSVRRTVFAVGDPKQSIYSFQGADPARFTAEAAALEQAARALGAPFAAPAMTMSFRSAPEILKAVDATFEAIQDPGDPPAQFHAIAHQAKRSDSVGCVEWWPLAPRPDRQPAKAWDAPLDQDLDDSATVRLAAATADAAYSMLALQEAVSDETGGDRLITAGDILILVRSRGRLFNQILQACKRKGLPVAGADRLLLAQDIAVQDALCLIRAAIDPYDDLSLASLLKGPFIGLTDDEAHLYPIASRRAPGEALYDRLMAADDEPYGEAKAFLARLRARRALPAFEFLAQALEERGADGRSGWRRVFERLGPEAADPLQELLNKALAAGSRGESGLQAFLTSIEQDEALIKRELEGPNGAIRIMTVHGAKGLEAPVVILPDTTKGPTLSADAGLFLEDGGCALALTGQSEDDPATAALRAACEARALGEHWRLLYVAMTRARDRLIVCGHARGQKGSADPQSWHEQVKIGMERLGAHRMETPFGAGYRIGRTRTVSPAHPASEKTAVAPPGWASGRSAPPAPTLATLRPSGALTLSPRSDRRLFVRGTLIHGLLQRLPDIPAPRRRDAGLAWLERQGVGANPGEAYLEEALAVIEDPRLAAAFGPNSRAEAGIVATLKARAVRGIIDRLVVTEAMALAIDFKTDRAPPADPQQIASAYVLQMAIYRAALQQALPGRQVQCALVFTYAPLVAPLSAAQMDDSLRRAGLD